MVATVHGGDCPVPKPHTVAATAHGRDQSVPELYTVAPCTLPGREPPYRVRFRPITAHGRDSFVPKPRTVPGVAEVTVHGREQLVQ